MIVVVDDRCLVYDAYRSSFGREGVTASGFTSNEFQEWVNAAAEDDVRAVDAFLLGECHGQNGLASIIKKRCAAAVIAMRDERSLSSTLELFADGVDDVVVKPCHVKELLARIEAIARRGKCNDYQANDREIRIFRDGREAIVAGAELQLPRRELRILEFLVANRVRRVTRGQIFSSVYGIFDQDVDEKVIESHISKLRRRLKARLGYDPIESRRHLGYRLICRSMSAGN